MPNARVILSWYFLPVFSHGDLAAATAVLVRVYEYVSTERWAPSALLLISRPEPAPADCGLATERRADRASRAKHRRHTAV